LIRTEAIPGCDAEGFIQFHTLRKQAEEESVDVFVERYDVPSLYVIDVGKVSEGDPDATVEPGGIQLLTMMDKGKSAFRYLDQVGFLVKRPTNPFPNFVSVGRSANNDLVIGVETVSKLHAYFTHEGGVWRVTDHRSTNGTQLNGKAVPPETPEPVKDGDRIQVGKEISVVFLEPRSLYARARGLKEAP
jgi:hypothetical protein